MKTDEYYINLSFSLETSTHVLTWDATVFVEIYEYPGGTNERGWPVPREIESVHTLDAIIPDSILITPSVSPDSLEFWTSFIENHTRLELDSEYNKTTRHTA